jgi:hypothetical protein
MVRLGLNINNARRQQRRRRQVPTANINIRTSRQARKRPARRRNQIPRQIMAGSSDNSGVRYMKCVLGQGGAAKIPDGDSHHSVLIEYKQTQSFVPNANGNLCVVCQPALPGALRVLEGGGGLQTIHGTGLTIPDVYPNGVSIPFSDFLVSSNNSLQTNKPGIIIARVTSYNMEVKQVGAVLNQQGVVATARVPPELSGTVIIPVCGIFSAANALWTGTTFDTLTACAYPAKTGRMLDPSFTSISTFPLAKVCNATEPCMLVGKGCGSWVPTYFGNQYWTDFTTGGTNPTSDGVLTLGTLPTITSAGIAAQGGATSSAYCPYIPGGADNALVGDFWADPECESLIWAGAQLGNSTQFLVTVSMCMEVIVDYNGSIYRPLVSPPVAENHAAIDSVDRVMKIMPPSIAKSEGSQSWWNALTSGVTGVAEIVGELGIPVVSAAANVGTRMLKMLGIGR